MQIIDHPLFVSGLVFIAAALAQSYYQLGVSVLTLLSGHSLGAKRSHARLLHLDLAYSFGALATVALLLGALSYVLTTFDVADRLLWSIAAGLCIGTGIAIALFYHRRGKGTTLWVPRPIVDYLVERTKKTKRGVEAFFLGSATVISELPLMLAPLLVVGLLLRGMPTFPHLAAIGGYALITALPLLVLTILLGGGHKLSTIQRWRETNKAFLQFASGILLILLGLYLIVMYTQGVNL